MIFSLLLCHLHSFKLIVFPQIHFFVQTIENSTITANSLWYKIHKKSPHIPDHSYVIRKSTQQSRCFETVSCPTIQLIFLYRQSTDAEEWRKTPSQSFPILLLISLEMYSYSLISFPYCERSLQLQIIRQVCVVDEPK